MSDGCIVIVAYNGETHLDAALTACARHAPGVDVIVVDNGSTDGSRRLAAAHASAPLLVPQARNRGYGAGANAGIAVARAGGASWVLLQNQDAVICEGTVERCAAVLRDSGSTAAVQPLVLDPDGRVNSAGNPLHWLGFSYAGGNGTRLEAAASASELPWLRDPCWLDGVEVPAISGAAVMLRLEALRQCGGFEPWLFLYHEDFELSWRLRRAGWTLQLAGGARVVHDYAFTRNPGKWYHLERNRWWTLLAHLRPPTLAVLSMPLAAAELAVLRRAAGEGWLGEKARAWRYWAEPGRVGYLRGRRRAFARLQRHGDGALLAAATTTMQGVADGSLSARVAARWWAVLRKLVR